MDDSNSNHTRGGICGNSGKERGIKGGKMYKFREPTDRETEVSGKEMQNDQGQSPR